MTVVRGRILLVRNRRVLASIWYIAGRQWTDSIAGPICQLHHHKRVTDCTTCLDRQTSKYATKLACVSDVVGP